jgi:hypothetical protein
MGEDLKTAVAFEPDGTMITALQRAGIQPGENGDGSC